MTGLRLNLGCGAKREPGFINVDTYGNPDVVHDLETFPWPWADNSVAEIQLIHVLEHLGWDPKVYLRIFQEMYRVCQPGATIYIVVPHFRHDNFYDDPTHVRAVTPFGLMLFSKRLNEEWVASGSSNNLLALQLGVNFELRETGVMPGHAWLRHHPEPNFDMAKLEIEAESHNNMIQAMSYLLEVVK